MKTDETSYLKVPLVRLKLVRSRTVKYKGETVNNPDSVVEMTWPIFKELDREIFVVVGLNSQNLPHTVNIVSTGTVNQAPVFPLEVFKPLILANCSSFICLHNHPSGTLEPSSADKEMTKKLKEAGNLLGVPLMDHIILSYDKSYYAFSKHNLI